MNTLKQLSTLLLVTLISSASFAQGAEKTLVKSFNIEGVQEVNLNLPGTVDVQHRDNKLMRVQMNIVIENGSVHMLKSLVTAGRYNIDAMEKEGDYIVYAPNMNKEITLQGQPLQEKIAYTVFVPENVSVKLLDTSSTSSLEKTEEEPVDESAL